MGFLDASKAFFARCFDYRGRSSRSEFWWPTLLGFAVGFACSVLESVLNVRGIGNVATLAITVPSISLQVRRLHDTGRSGWWVAADPAIALACLVAYLALGPSVGYLILAGGGLAMLGISLAMLFWFCEAGTPGPNAHGPDPLGGQSQARLSGAGA